MDVLVQILNGGIDFTKILTIVLIYLAMLWFALCLWVFVDARKRYTNPIVPFLFFLGVFFLNFPLLVFYLVIRPENPEENIFYLDGGETSSQGGVNVPVVNFVGANGEVQFALNLKISKEFSQNGMNVNVGWESNNSSYVQAKKLEAVKVVEAPTTKMEEKKVIKVVSAPVVESKPVVTEAAPVKKEEPKIEKKSVFQNAKDGGKRFNNGLKNMAGNIAGKIKLAKKSNPGKPQSDKKK